MHRTVWVCVFLVTALSSVLANDERIKKLEEKLATAKDTARVNILNNLSQLYSAVNLRHADSLARLAFVELKNHDYPEGKITNYNIHSWIKGAIGQFDEAQKLTEQAIELSTKLGNKKLLAESYDYLFIFHFLRGENDKALPAAEKALQYAQEANYKKYIAQSYNNLGIMKGIKGFHNEAIEYFMKSLVEYEALHDDKNSARSLMHIGHTFELAENYPKALEYTRRAYLVHKRTNNIFDQAWGLIGIGVIWSRMDRLDSALIYYERALVIAEKLNNQRLILTALDNIGGKYSLKKDFVKANHYLRRAYSISEASGKNSRTVYITGNLAENYLYEGKYDSARIFGEKQLKLALEDNLIAEQKVAYYNLAAIYDSLRNYKKAHEALLGYIRVNDSIFNQQKSQQIEELRESFETERKEREIESLTQVNESTKFKNRAYATAAVSLLVVGGLMFYALRLRIRRGQLRLEQEQEMDKMKSLFFANISHEFRTPLTLLLGPISDLLAKTQDSHDKKHLTVMRQNANRLLHLVNQLLDLSKLESGSLKLQATSGDIITIIKGVSLSFHSVMERKEIELSLNVSPDSLIINFDRAKIETVLTNLLSNAFKFTPEGGRIHIETRLIRKKVKLREREFIEFCVTDSGSGIPEHDIDKIFNRFYQSETNQLLQHEGSGIGLALSKELVELHEGSIRASSTEGEGTRITFEIPIDLVATDSAVVPGSSESVSLQDIINPEVHDLAEEAIPSDTKPVILVVEDHAEVQSYIRDILNEKFLVHSAQDGEEGIAKAIQIVPDLIVSDVMMPRKDGYELSQTLKNDERTSHIPIVLLTAKADSEDKIQGLKTQADDYVVKPFVPKELLIRIENLIQSRKQLQKKFKKQGTLKPSEVTENPVDVKFLNRLMEVLERELGNEHFGVEQLSDALHMSRSQLHRKLKGLIGQGPNQFIRSFRLNRAFDLLKQHVATTSEIAYRVGFSSPSYFTKCFQEQFGYVPSEIDQHS